MKILVEDLLFLARLDTKDQRQIFSSIDLSNAVFQSTLPFEPVYFELGKRLESEISPKLFINGDTAKIKQLVTILLDNAQKFSPPNTAVKLSLKKENNSAVLSVSYQSESIDPTRISKLFDRFYRLYSARTRPRR